MNDAARIVDALHEADEIDPKAFVQARDAAAHHNPLTVEGSYGTLKVDPVTGIVLGYENYPKDDEVERGDAYHDIVKFDLPELRQWIKRHGSPEWRGRADEIVGPGSALDIVNVGFWTNDGEYVPGEEEHRLISWNDHEP